MFDVPENAQEINPNAKDDGIQLPFVAPIFYWRHGDSRFSSEQGVLHFGGWETQEADLFRDEFGALPDGMREVNHKWGNAMAVRNLTIAPIRTRKRWVERSHSQTICLVAKKSEDGQLVKSGVAVLSVKGWTTKYLSDAIAEWGNNSKDGRKEHAIYKIGDGEDRVIPPWYFWQSVGTFGDFQSESVGSNNTSETTQPRTVNFRDITKEILGRLYVGGENWSLMSELYKEAEEWANDERWLNGDEQVVEENSLPPLPDVAESAINEEELPF